MAEGETVEKPVAALVKYLNERKTHSREKGKVSSRRSLLFAAICRPVGDL